MKAIKRKEAKEEQPNINEKVKNFKM